MLSGFQKQASREVHLVRSQWWGCLPHSQCIQETPLNFASTLLATLRAGTVATLKGGRICSTHSCKPKSIQQRTLVFKAGELWREGSYHMLVLYRLRPTETKVNRFSPLSPAPRKKIVSRFIFFSVFSLSTPCIFPSFTVLLNVNLMVFLLY